MSSYLTPYNVAIANKQRGFDVANLRHDAYQASQTPLRGGQVRGDAVRQGDYQLEGGDFWSDFADGFMSVMRPVGQVLPFLGAGMSGGDEITDAEPALLNPDLNSTGQFQGYGFFDDLLDGIGKVGQVASAVAPHIDTGMRLYDRFGRGVGAGMSGGDFLSDLGNIASQVAPFLPLLGLGKSSTPAEKTKAVGRALVGCGFFDDLLDGISKVGQVATAVAPHIETGMKLYDKYGKGMSGGATKKHQAIGRKIFTELKALHGAGLSGGDFDWGTLASFAPLLLGLGMSGGQAEPDMSYLEPFVSGFGMSGGSFVNDLLSGIDNAVGKVGDFLETGVQKVNEGLDKVIPIVDKVGKIVDTVDRISGAVSGRRGGALSLEQNMNMADAMGDIFSGMGRANATRVKSGKQQLYKGGNIANAGLLPKNRPANAGMSGGDTSVNAPYVGWNEATNTPYARPVGGSSEALVALQQRSNVNQPYLTGDGARCCSKASKKGKGVSGGQAGNSESLDQMEATDALVKELASANPAVNASPAGASGGKKRPASKWIEHAKAYAKTHGVSYKQALQDAKATYRGGEQKDYS